MIFNDTRYERHYSFNINKANISLLANKQEALGMIGIIFYHRKYTSHINKLRINIISSHDLFAQLCCD